MGKIGKDTWSELKLIKGRAVINGGWRWGWLFSGGCGPLLKQPPVQALRESMTYLGETEKTDAEVEQWNARFLKEKSLREQSSAEYAISVASWLIGANALLKQLEIVEKDEEEEEDVNVEFEDCSEDNDGEKDIVEAEDTNIEEQMSKEGLVALVKQDGNDDQVDTDDEDPNYSPSTEKSDTEDDLSEEEEEDIEEKVRVVKLAEKKRNKERQEDETTDEESGDEEMEDKEKIKRNIFGRKKKKNFWGKKKKKKKKKKK